MTAMPERDESSGPRPPRGGRGWWRRHREGAAALANAAPAMLFLFALYVLPMLMLLAQSVEGGSLTHYQKALTDGLYVRVLVDTLLIAAYVSLACLLLAYPVAYFLSIAPGGWATVGIVFVLLPFWTSILVRTYGWMVLLGRNGIINRALLDSGLIDRMPQMITPERTPKSRSPARSPCSTASTIRVSGSPRWVCSIGE